MDIFPEILDWNVRGLNDKAKRDAVREFLDSVLELLDRFVVTQCLGPAFDGFVYTCRRLRHVVAS
jgi:hypothetical protein